MSHCICEKHKWKPSCPVHPPAQREGLYLPPGGSAEREPRGHVFPLVHDCAVEGCEPSCS